MCVHRNIRGTTNQMFPCHEAKQRRYNENYIAAFLLAQGSPGGQATNGNCGFEIGSCELAII